MLTVKFYLTLKWLGWHWLRRLPLKDRWGFNLGEDLEEWATLRMFIYLRKLEKAAGFEPTQPARGPRFTVGSPTMTTGTSTTWLWKGGEMTL
jgi:hypothetical protein